MKDCTTCKYGYEDERLGIPMCHHPKRFSEDCVDFNMYEEKEIKESEKPMEQEKEVEPCHRTRKKLAEWSNTPEGRESYKKVAEEMRKQIVPKDLEEAAEISFDEAYALTEDYMDFLAKGLKENQPRPIGPHWFCEYAKNRFIAGAKWDREKIMSEAVEADIMLTLHDKTGDISLHTGYLPKELGIKYGDKVRIIIVKEKENEQSD